MGTRRGPRQAFMIRTFSEYETLVKHIPGKKLFCQRCNGQLEVGNMIVPRGLRSGKVVHYHEDCWEALLH